MISREPPSLSEAIDRVESKRMQYNEAVFAERGLVDDVTELKELVNGLLSENEPLHEINTEQNEGIMTLAGLIMKHNVSIKYMKGDTEDMKSRMLIKNQEYFISDCTILINIVLQRCDARCMSWPDGCDAGKP